MVRAAVIGAGSWGTALAKLLSEKGLETTLWCRGEECYRAISEGGENVFYLPGIRLPRSLKVTRSLPGALERADLVVCALPSHGVRSTLAGSAASLSPGALVVCGTKGLEEESQLTMAEVLEQILGAATRRFAFLSGPTFAAEVARGLPAAATVAAADEGVAREAQLLLSDSSFRVYTSTDVVGVQLGGVIKNVIAIAAGISDGLGLGQSGRAGLIARGLAEMTRLAAKMGAQPATLYGLAGTGDLVLTCTGELSRNRHVGLEIGRGRKLGEILSEMRMVAEGVRNTRAVYLLARRLGVEMPIVEQMHLVLNCGKDPREAVRDLLQRSLKSETGQL
jgi:glycerol-3-phosphate dehydrogenase (NAD(P)+)